MDLYQLLGIQNRASTEEIRKAYRLKLYESHPDRRQNRGLKPFSSETINNLKDAYRTLCTKQSRLKYDSYLENQRLMSQSPISDTMNLVEDFQQTEHGYESVEECRCSGVFSIPITLLNNLPQGLEQSVLVECENCSLVIEVKIPPRTPEKVYLHYHSISRPSEYECILVPYSNEADILKYVNETKSELLPALQKKFPGSYFRVVDYHERDCNEAEKKIFKHKSDVFLKCEKKNSHSAQEQSQISSILQSDRNYTANPSTSSHVYIHWIEMKSSDWNTRPVRFSSSYDQVKTRTAKILGIDPKGFDLYLSPSKDKVVGSYSPKFEILNGLDLFVRFRDIAVDVDANLLERFQQLCSMDLYRRSPLLRKIEKENPLNSDTIKNSIDEYLKRYFKEQYFSKEAKERWLFDRNSTFILALYHQNHPLALFLRAHFLFHTLLTKQSREFPEKIPSEKEIGLTLDSINIALKSSPKKLGIELQFLLAETYMSYGMFSKEAAKKAEQLDSSVRALENIRHKEEKMSEDIDTLQLTALIYSPIPKIQQLGIDRLESAFGKNQANSRFLLVYAYIAILQGKGLHALPHLVRGMTLALQNTRALSSLYAKEVKTKPDDVLCSIARKARWEFGALERTGELLGMVFQSVEFDLVQQGQEKGKASVESVKSVVEVLSHVAPWKDLKPLIVYVLGLSQQTKYQKLTNFVKM